MPIGDNGSSTNIRDVSKNARKFDSTYPYVGNDGSANGKPGDYSPDPHESAGKEDIHDVEGS